MQNVCKLMPSQCQFAHYIFLQCDAMLPWMIPGQNQSRSFFRGTKSVVLDD